MGGANTLTISGAVEGLVDEAVLRRLIVEAGAVPGSICGRDGKHYLRDRIKGYNSAARHAPWIVFVDLDHDEECAPPLRRAWLPQPARYMLFRVVVRAIEAWLLADRDRLASFLGISAARVPDNPDGLSDPKHALVQLAAKSRRREIREDMAPRPASGRPIGPAYTSRLMQFAAEEWNPKVAARNSPSLCRCHQRIAELIATCRQSD